MNYHHRDAVIVRLPACIAFSLYLFSYRLQTQDPVSTGGITHATEMATAEGVSSDYVAVWVVPPFLHQRNSLHMHRLRPYAMLYAFFGRRWHLVPQKCEYQI